LVSAVIHPNKNYVLTNIIIVKLGLKGHDLLLQLEKLDSYQDVHKLQLINLILAVVEAAGIENTEAALKSSKGLQAVLSVIADNKNSKLVYSATGLVYLLSQNFKNQVPLLKIPNICTCLLTFIRTSKPGRERARLLAICTLNNMAIAVDNHSELVNNPQLMAVLLRIIRTNCVAKVVAIALVCNLAKRKDNRIILFEIPTLFELLVSTMFITRDNEKQAVMALAAIHLLTDPPRVSPTEGMGDAYRIKMVRCTRGCFSFPIHMLFPFSISHYY